MILKTSKSLVFLFSIAYLPLFSQKKLPNAAIITKSKDTLSGYIDFKEMIATPKKISFRKAGSSEKTYYTPSQIEGFMIKDNDLVFKSASIKINSEKFKFEEARLHYSLDSAVSDIRWKKDSVFLLTLVKGKKSLYEYTDENVVSHLIVQEGNSDYETLVNLKFKMMVNEKLSVVYFEEYKNQLKRLFSDCSNFEMNFKKIHYDGNNIPELVEKYNQCFNQQSYLKPLKKLKPHFYAAIGASKPKMQVSGYFGGKTIFNVNAVPTVSIGISCSPYLSPLREKFDIVGLEVNVTSFSVKDSIYIFFIDKVTHSDVRLTGIHLMPFFQQNLVLRNTPTSKMAAYIKVSPIVSFYPITKYVNKVIASGITLNTEQEKIRRMGFGVTGNVGLRFNRYFIEGRYEPFGTDISERSSGFVQHGRISLMAGYLF